MEINGNIRTVKRVVSGNADMQRVTLNGNIGMGGGGTTDYNALENKPSINNVELIGNLSLEDLDIASYSSVGNIDFGSGENYPIVGIMKYTDNDGGTGLVIRCDDGTQEGRVIYLYDNRTVAELGLTLLEKIREVREDVPTALSQLTNDANYVQDASYVHTDNNFTTALEDKLNNIESGAEVNVQANWNETNSSSDAYIQNKPTIPTTLSDLTNDANYVQDADYVHTDNNYTDALKALTETLVEVNVLAVPFDANGNIITWALAPKITDIASIKFTLMEYVDIQHMIITHFLTPQEMVEIQQTRTIRCGLITYPITADILTFRYYFDTDTVLADYGTGRIAECMAFMSADGYGIDAYLTDDIGEPLAEVVGYIHRISNKNFTNDAGYIVDAHYVHTDNNFTTELKRLMQLKVVYADGYDINQGRATSFDDIYYLRFGYTTDVGNYHPIQNATELVNLQNTYALKFLLRIGNGFLTSLDVLSFLEYETANKKYPQVTADEMVGMIHLNMVLISTNGYRVTVQLTDDNGTSISTEPRGYIEKLPVSQFDVDINYALANTVGGVAKQTSGILFGTLDSTSTATVMTATVGGFTELYDGLVVYLMNGVVTSASGFTLNINNTGALPVYSTLAAASRSTTIFNINYTMMFVYNSTRVAGGCWDVFYGYDSNTNTIGYQLRTNSQSLPMAQKVYRYRLLFTSADGTHFVGANTSTSTNATAVRSVNQTPINPFGAIYYYGYTTAIDAESRIGTSYLWQQYVITLGYSFNSTGAALVLDTFKPLYIKCSPQADGSAIIDSTTPYVQALPSTEDGYIYIFLGIAVTATTVEITMYHPVYQYVGGAIQLYTGINRPTSSTVSKFEIVNGDLIVTDKNGNTHTIAMS